MRGIALWTSANASPSWRRCASSRHRIQCLQRRLKHDGKVFRENDIVLLRPTTSIRPTPLLVTLKANGSISTHKGIIKHSELISSRVRDTVQTSKGHAYRLSEPTLAEYVTLTPRLVTPIYPQDANLIVSLFDIHVDKHGEGADNGNGEKLEILEAGTGHGALTLHLSRAIHAANAPFPGTGVPQSPSPQTRIRIEPSLIRFFRHLLRGASWSSITGATSDEPSNTLAAWKAQRHAVLHTIDINAKYSAHAQKIVRGFRHGMYSRNVDFHTGSVSDWLSSTLPSRSNQPFLSHVFLDLPGADTYLDIVAQALKVDGKLAIFNPSITQIVDCVRVVREKNLPFALDQVVELGSGGGGARQWDVRAVKPRAVLKKEKEQQEAEVDSEAAAAEKDTDSREEEERVDQDHTPSAKPSDDGWTFVCRPKVGDRVVGGGFVGVWRKIRQDHSLRRTW